MLKLEKTRHCDIAVSLRNQRTRFNRPFFYAFGIALALHFIPALFFYIRPFISIGDAVLPPVFVETDLTSSAENSHGVLAYLDQEGRPSRYSLEPPLSSPQMPETMPASISHQAERPKSQNFTDNPFAGLEEDWDYLFASDHSTPAAQAPIRLRISGGLSEQILIDDGIHQKISIPMQCDGSHIVVYDIRVEGESGLVFWHMAKQSSPLSPLNRTAEAILCDMRFKPDPNIFVQDGVVEIIFTFGNPQLEKKRL